MSKRKKGPKDILEEFRLDVLDELIVKKVCNDLEDEPVNIFYKIKDGEKHFSDWDLASVNSKIYSDEKCEQTSLKELLFIIACMEYPKSSIDVIVTYVNLWWLDVTPYKLSQDLGVSKQFVYGLLNQAWKFPDERKKQIAEALKFDVREFEWQRTNYVFDDSDV